MSKRPTTILEEKGELIRMESNDYEIHYETKPTGVSSTLSTGKPVGRNSFGHITVLHRGGGSKRLQRRIDLK
uniref:Large ribosomal subunit protein uL2 RNA-binding domain-containing protein n=1 Tax=Nelumbo nucifera TaxID=4432 RepID=A0A822ZYH5_NELNU|nr:TPA_asm: hypothetical protein HUJ06_017833 [Nelumbo nucifera]